MAFRAKVTTKHKRTAQRFILAGGVKIGKTWFASTIDHVFILSIEEGLDGAHPDYAPGHFDALPRTFHELMQALDLFEKEREEQPEATRWRHLVLDGLSGIELLVHAAAQGEEKISHMEGADFKKAWSAALSRWRELQARLEKVRRSGVHVWLIAHEAEVREVDMSTGETWPRKDVHFTGPAREAAELRTLWRGWADHILFLDWAKRVVSPKKGRRAFGTFSGRVLHLRESPTHRAGSRSGALRSTVPAAWPDLLRVLTESARPSDTARLRSRAEELLRQLGGEDSESVAEDLARADTVPALRAVIARAEGLAALVDADEENGDAEPDQPRDDDEDDEPGPSDEQDEPEAGQASKGGEPPPEDDQPEPQRDAHEKLAGTTPETLDAFRQAVDEAIAAGALEQLQALVPLAKGFGADAFDHLLDTVPTEELPAVASAIASAGLPNDVAGALRASYVARRNGGPSRAAEATL